MKDTTFKNTYWTSNGERQADFNNLSKLLVPIIGKADTFHGELLRAITVIYNDRFDNKLRGGFWVESRNLINNFERFKLFCEDPDKVFTFLRCIPDHYIGGSKPVEDKEHDPDNPDENWDYLAGCYIKINLWTTQDDLLLEDVMTAVITYAATTCQIEAGNPALASHRLTFVQA